MTSSVETSVLFTLFADRLLPRKLDAFWRRGAVGRVAGAMTGSDSVAVPCSGTKVETRYLGPHLVAAALWQLREDGAIEIVRREPPERRVEALSRGVARLGAALDRLSPPPEPVSGMPGPVQDPFRGAIPIWDGRFKDGLITITPADPKGRGPGLERTLLEMVRAAGETTPADLANQLKRATRDGPAKRSARFSADPVKAGGGAVGVCVEAAIEAGLLTAARGGAEGEVIDMAGWQVVPDCDRIAALGLELESALEGWTAFKDSEPELAEQLVSFVYSRWAPDPAAGDSGD